MSVDLEGEIEGYSKGVFKQDMEGDLLRSSSGLVKFNSLELDSEVRQLVRKLHSDYRSIFHGVRGKGWTYRVSPNIGIFSRGGSHV